MWFVYRSRTVAVHSLLLSVADIHGLHRAGHNRRVPALLSRRFLKAACQRPN